MICIYCLAEHCTEEKCGELADEQYQRANGWDALTMAEARFLVLLIEKEIQSRKLIDNA